MRDVAHISGTVFLLCFSLSIICVLLDEKKNQIPTRLLGWLCTVGGISVMMAGYWFIVLLITIIWLL
jgi:hypothetical protein